MAPLLVLRRLSPRAPPPCVARAAISDFLVGEEGSKVLLVALSEEQPLANFDAYNKYGQMIDRNLTALAEKEGVSAEDVVRVCAIMQAEDGGASTCVDYILASVDYETFLGVIADWRALFGDGEGGGGGEAGAEAGAETGDGEGGAGGEGDEAAAGAGGGAGVDDDIDAGDNVYDDSEEEWGPDSIETDAARADDGAAGTGSDKTGAGAAKHGDGAGGEREGKHAESASKLDASLDSPSPASKGGDDDDVKPSA